MYQRLLTAKRLGRRTCIWWGPRHTGKSTLLRWLCPIALTYDLRDSARFRHLRADPGLLGVARTTVASFVGAHADDLAFVTNTTTGDS